MHLDLRQSAAVIRKHIAQRVRGYAKRRNKGPGKPGDPVTQITIGFQFDQAGWFALVFDTRPEAESDGKWNSFIKPNAQRVPGWSKAFSSLGEDGSPLRLTKHDGKTKILGTNTDEEAFARHLGATMRKVLEEARRKGAFSGIPLAGKCALTVEEHDGHYGWSTAPRGEKEAKERKKQLGQLAGKVSSKPRKEQIAHWIAILEGVASGPKKKDGDWRLVFDVMGKLERLGNDSTIPLLEFVEKWSSEPEWIGDLPKRETAAMWEPCDAIFDSFAFYHLDVVSPKAETLLCSIVSRSVKANRGRRLWGRIPGSAARLLQEFFGRPEPVTKEATYELVNHAAFTKPSHSSRAKAARNK